jgi:hypothetical protein
MSEKSKFTKVYHRSGARKCKKLIIAVHGMGDQSRNDMARVVAGLFAKVFAKRTKIDNQAIRLPQGLWEGRDATSPVQDDLISYSPDEAHAAELQDLADMAFAEIHWADIPRDIEENGHRLESPPQWAGSVVDRLRQREDLKQSYSGSDVTTGATVVEEIAETIKILDRVLMPLEKAGAFTFDLGRILNQYLGDVQQVADFMYVRERFLKRFRERIDYLASISEAGEIHFIAHSEGSVLTLRTLLRALNTREQECPDTPPWLSRVRSLTTLGSPIDKHLILWPEMWGWLSEGEIEARDATGDEQAHLLRERHSHWHRMETPIRWRNYYDYADPVGYDLDTAREKLALWGCDAFEFSGDQHDHGFRRYPLAGMAHIDYFNDPDLFEHIYEHAIRPTRDVAKPADTKWGKLSPYIPFGIVTGIHIAAIVVLHRAMEPDQMKQVLAMLGKVSSRADGDLVEWLRSLPGMIACGLVLTGTTSWSRTGVIEGWSRVRTIQSTAFYFGTLVVLGLTAKFSHPAPSFGSLMLAVGLPSFLLVMFVRIMDDQTRASGRSPLWALRWQMILGGAAVGLAALIHVKDPNASMLTAVLGALTFMYVWWLGVLLFDLCYVWKRYINTKGDTFLDKLRQRAKWHHAP